MTHKNLCYKNLRENNYLFMIPYIRNFRKSNTKATTEMCLSGVSDRAL